MQGRLRPDWQLQVRMAFTMLLLGALYLLFAVVLYRAGAGIGLTAVLVGGMALLQYYYSDRLVLLTTGARLVGEDELPEVHDMVGRLAAMADLPKPRVALVPTPMPNAFATGRNPANAVVAVTEGLLRTLPPEELEAVLGHEITHIKNRDMAVLAMASFFSTIAGYLAQWLAYGAMWGGYGGYGDRRNREGESLGTVLLVSWIVQVLSFFLIAALSRYREYAADRGSALLTGQPSHLASALLRISGAMERIPTRDLRQAQAVNAFFIVPAAVGDEGWLELFMTHPSLEHRLQHLRRIELELARFRA
jgi:heat shock protein HtpX